MLVLAVCLVHVVQMIIFILRRFGWACMRVCVCVVEVDQCVNDPCGPGGMCISFAGHHDCQCYDGGYYGHDCQWRTTDTTTTSSTPGLEMFVCHRLSLYAVRLYLHCCAA